MRLILDTNAWFRLFDSPHDIRADVRQQLQAEKRLALSVFSLIENF